MSEPRRFDPSQPVFVDVPSETSMTLKKTGEYTKEIVPEPTVNPLIAYVTNHTMSKESTDEEGPSTAALPVPW